MKPQLHLWCEPQPLTKGCVIVLRLHVLSPKESLPSGKPPRLQHDRQSGEAGLVRSEISMLVTCQCRPSSVQLQFTHTAQ